MTTVQRALAWSFAERYLLIALSLGSSMLIARLLTPAQIGIYSVTLAVVGIVQVLRDFGVGSFLIQKKELDADDVRSAFGVSLLIGVTLFAALALAAPAIGRFYREPAIVSALRICSLNFLVIPFATIALSLLRREMRFAPLVKISVASGVVGAVLSVVLAWAGWAQDGLAVSGVVVNVLTCIGAWLARRPESMLRPSLARWRAVARFGGQTTVTGLVTTIAVDINDIALGRILGFAPVAMLSRAQGVMNLFHRDLMAAIRGVALPAFAQLHRESAAVAAKHEAAVGAVTLLAWPFYAFASLHALELMRLLFGPQWDDAARLAPWFCLAGAVAALANLVYTAVIAVERIDLVTRAELVFQPLRAALTVAVAFATESLWACAMVYLAVQAACVPLAYAVMARCLPVRVGALARQALASAQVTACSIAGPLLFVLPAGLDRTAPVESWRFALSAAAAALGWLVGAVALRHPVIDDPIARRVLERLPFVGRWVG